MQEAQSNLFTRDDTFFGVCEGLGQDLGISPNLLRLAFAIGTFFNPVGAIAAGGEMRAHFAMFLDFEGDRIRGQRNYDCFEAF
jgi:hypothetical protein